MRFFQNSGVYPSYLVRLNTLAPKTLSFSERRRIILDDRFGALHFLQPVLDGDADTFFTNGNDGVLQRQWARENGMSAAASPEAILLAQIEHHRADVFYNTDPTRFPSAFVRKLPGCVKKALCWRVAPSGQADLTAYGAVLGNFPMIADEWRRKGCRVEMFFPAIDPVMDQYGNGDRLIDILFVGGYSRYHMARAKILERVASLADSRQVVYCLDASRLTRLAESRVGALLPLRKYRRPAVIAKIAQPPVFGRQLYELIGKSKVVLNGTIDTAGADRGNLRCFEAIGCGALLVADAGNYPEGMVPDQTMVAYGTSENCVEQIQRCLIDWKGAQTMADNGRRQVKELYSKTRQWALFMKILASL
jgi:hypothetical protein